MSERGSFVTEFIYCHDCRTRVLAVLSKEMDGVIELPIGGVIAGRVQGMYPGEEIDYFEEHTDLHRDILQAICHPLRLCVLAEAREKVFHFDPDGTGE